MKQSLRVDRVFAKEHCSAEDGRAVACPLDTWHPGAPEPSFVRQSLLILLHVARLQNLNSHVEVTSILEYWVGRVVFLEKIRTNEGVRATCVPTVDVCSFAL